MSLSPLSESSSNIQFIINITYIFNFHFDIYIYVYMYFARMVMLIFHHTLFTAGNAMNIFLSERTYSESILLINYSKIKTFFGGLSGLGFPKNSRDLGVIDHSSQHQRHTKSCPHAPRKLLTPFTITDCQ